MRGKSELLLWITTLKSEIHKTPCQENHSKNKLVESLSSKYLEYLKIIMLCLLWSYLMHFNCLFNAHSNTQWRVLVFALMYYYINEISIFAWSVQNVECSADVSFVVLKYRMFHIIWIAMPSSSDELIALMNLLYWFIRSSCIHPPASATSELRTNDLWYRLYRASWWIRGFHTSPFCAKGPLPYFLIFLFHILNLYSTSVTVCPWFEFVLVVICSVLSLGDLPNFPICYLIV